MKTANLTKLLAPLFGLALLAGCNKAEEPPKPAAASPATSYLETIKARDKLIVGVFTDKPPFGFVDEKGRYVALTLTSAGAWPRTCWVMKTRSSSLPWNRPAVFRSCRATRSI